MTRLLFDPYDREQQIEPFLRMQSPVSNQQSAFAVDPQLLEVGGLSVFVGCDDNSIGNDNGFFRRNSRDRPRELRARPLRPEDSSA